MRQLKLITIQLLLLLLPLFTLMSSAAKQHVDWSRTEVMDPFGLYILHWRLERKDIIFTATVNTRGFIGLGFSYRHGRMTGSDLVLAWVDDHTGLPNVLVSWLLHFIIIIVRPSIVHCFCHKVLVVSSFCSCHSAKIETTLFLEPTLCNSIGHSLLFFSPYHISVAVDK